jgi:Fic family protein
MDGVGDEPGRYRSDDTAIFRGKKIIKMAPSPGQVPDFMDGLFKYLNSSNDLVIIKSCIAHFSMEYMQPFTEGSGLMARLWQTLLIFQDYRLFEYLPWEKQVVQTQNDYYNAIETGEKEGHPTAFIQYMLGVIDVSLNEVSCKHNRQLTASDRLIRFHQMGFQSFTRKDYIRAFKHISTATASRDLEKGVDAGLFEKRGTKNVTVYSCQKP